MVVDLGVQVGIVIGGGNIFRGVAPAASGMDRATADYISLYCTSFLPLQGNNYCMIRAGSQHNPLANDAKIRSILSSAIP